MTDFGPADAWDNMHGPSRPDVHWTTDNVGEAAPGVLSPLGASIWGTIGEEATRATFVDIGVLPESERGLPARLEDRHVRIFCGRLAISVELLCTLGDRMPGTSGAEIAKAMLGTVPDDLESHPTRRRYPIIAWRLGRIFFGMPRRLATEAPRFDRFWRESVDRLPELELEGVRRLLDTALDEFAAALLLQATVATGHAQLMHEALAGVIRAAGVGDLGVLSGTGGSELEVVGDIWLAAQARITMDEVVRRHGFHGPMEGEVSSTVWREDPSPLHRLVGEYARREDPRAGQAERLARLAEEQARVLAALPRARRPAARLVLRAAARRIPLRGVGKRSFLQGLDVIRACARRIGAELAARGELDDPEDAFFLTLDELRAPVPRDVRELVSRRRARREAYCRVSIPGAWKGQPQIQEVAPAGRRAATVCGIGVSAGTVEGIARVVTDPAFTDVEPDEILVAPTTDPSWASVMYISAALVVDLGGPISHAAVVARELGIPCVVNTRSGSRDIRTGDRLRVDGDTGTVHILEPAPVAAAEPA